MYEGLFYSGLNRKQQEQLGGIASLGVLGGVVGRTTLGLIDVPISVGGQMYAEKELRRKLGERSVSVEEITKPLPTVAYSGLFQAPPKVPKRKWKLTDTKGNAVSVNPDVLTEGTYARDLGEVLAHLIGVELTPEQRSAYQIGRFIGSISTTSKVVQSSTKHIPARPWLLRTAQAGWTGVAVDTLMQVEELAAKRQDSFSFESAIRTGGWFTLLGGIVEGWRAYRAAATDSYIINTALKQHPGWFEGVSRADLKHIAAAGRAAQQGMSHEAWLKKYASGQRLSKIARQLDKNMAKFKMKMPTQKLLPEKITLQPKPTVPPTVFESNRKILEGDIPEQLVRDLGLMPAKIKIAKPAVAGEAIVKAKPSPLARVSKKPIAIKKLDAPTFTELAARQPWEPAHVTIDGQVITKQDWLKDFREPGLSLYLTPKEYYLRILGFDEMIQPITNATKIMYLEQLDVNKWARGIEKKINKISKPRVKERLVAKLMGRSTDPVQKMTVLLNQYSDAPDFLSPPEKAVFTEIRNFTRELLARENTMRKRLGIEPIKEVKAYMTHWLDGLAKQAISKKYPFPHEVEYWIGRRIPKKIRNPLAEERKIKDDLLKYFSKDLSKLLSVMARYELRDIYLSEPYTVLKAQLKELEKEIPATARKELDTYLRHDIFGYPTDLDKIINTTLNPLSSIIGVPLKPLGRIITSPINTLSSGIRRSIMAATIWGRPKLAIRNLGQKLLIQNLYPQIDYLRAQFWKDPPGLMDMLRKQVYYKISHRKWEDIPIGSMVERAGMIPYQKAHAGFNYLSNVDVAMKTGWYYGQRMVKLSQDVNSSFYKNCAKRFVSDMPEDVKELAAKQIVGKKGPFYDAFTKKLWTPKDALIEATEAGSLTQWTYFMTDMPRLFRGHASRAMLSLQSWWQNYFFKHWREGLRRTFSGETSRGKYVRPVDRVNFLKGQITILGITEGVRKATGLDYTRFYFGLGPAPFYLSPLGQVMLGTLRYLTAKTDAQRKRALYTLKYSYKAFVPGSLAWKDLRGFLAEDYGLKQYLFYTRPVEKKNVKLINIYK